MTMFGFKTSEVLFLGLLLCIPVTISKDWFWYLTTFTVLSYAGYYIYGIVRVKRINIKGQGVFITGCDTGFGFTMAKHLDTLGFTVFAGCLFKDGDGANTLRSSTTGRMHVIELDVTKDESVDKAVKYVGQNVTETGLLAIVNNAGIQAFGEIEFCTMDVYKKVAEVNLFGMVRTTKAFLPLIRKYNGRIINVTSAQGRISLPFNAAYGITKFGAETFSDILRLEMRKFGVKVIIVEPGNFGGATGIVNIENLSRIKAQLDTMWEAATDEVKTTYGREYYDVLYKSADNVLARLNTYLPTGVMDVLRERTFLKNYPKLKSLQT